MHLPDYLDDNPYAAKEYEALKLSLWKKHEHNRAACTDAKQEFVREHTIKAKEAYDKCYA